MQKSDDLLLDQMQRFSEFARKLEEVQQRALIDALTGLASRGEGEAYLRSQLASAEPVSLLLVNLRQFKKFNEQWGHECGDELLISVGNVLLEYAGAFDVVCRWEGDKFVLASAPGEKAWDAEASCLSAKLSKPYEVSGNGGSSQVYVAASVGSAQSKPGDTMDELLARANADLSLHCSLSALPQ